MENLRQVINSKTLEDIFDIPENLKNKKVVITISSYDETRYKDLGQWQCRRSMKIVDANII